MKNPKKWWVVKRCSKWNGSFSHEYAIVDSDLGLLVQETDLKMNKWTFYSDEYLSERLLQLKDKDDNINRRCKMLLDFLKEYKIEARNNKINLILK